MSPTGTINTMENSSYLKSRRHARNFSDEAANYVTIWSESPFASDRSLSQIGSHDDDAWESSKPPLLQLIDRTSKPRPSPIYKDKRVEEYWAFLKSVPECEAEQLPQPPSRCPSLMSRGTLSSRNSSTRSTKSSILDPIEDRRTSVRGLGLISNWNNPWSQDDEADVRWIPATEFPVLGCPLILCDHHSRGFRNTTDRKQHIFGHFSGVLQCGFCKEDQMSFNKTANRVDLFLEHLINEHGACGEILDLESNERSSTCFEGPVATCTVCAEPFGVQGFYEHLPGCILRAVSRNEQLQLGEELRIHDLITPKDQSSLQQVSVPKLRPEETSTSDGNSPCPPILVPSIKFLHAESEDLVELTASSRCLSLTSSKAVESSDEESDWTEEQTSRESSPGYSQLPRRLTPAKKRIVEKIMQDFQKLSDQGLRSHTTAGDSSGSSHSGQSGWSSGTSIYSASSFNSRKRSLSGGGSTPPNDDEDSNKRQRPDPRADGKKTVGELRFACPYYKRNPGKHQTFTSCRDPGFTTVARLKEHLYRRHLLPPQCHRCCTTFANDIKLREHQRDPRGCEVREQLRLEGFDKDQERKLKSKKKSQAYQTEEEKWKGVYRVLFPDDCEDQIPTPYIEYQPCIGQNSEVSNIVRFQEFSRLELPRLVRHTLEAAVEHEAQPLEDKLKERLLDIVKECQSQLLQMFQGLDGHSSSAECSATLSAPIMQAAEIAPTGRSTRAADDAMSNIFEDFDNLPMQSTATTLTPSIDSELVATMTKPPVSSSSSDSGYDSTRPQIHASEPSLNTSNTNLTIPPNFNHDDFIDIGGCFDLLEHQLDSTGVSPDVVLDMGTSAWSFIEAMQYHSDTNRMAHRSLEELAPGWNL